MTQAFKCPMCAAPLGEFHSSALQVRCPYCGNTVIVPEELRGGERHGSLKASASSAGSFTPMIDQALKLAEVAQQLKAGNKITAIKLYRETFGVGLKEAKEAVEKIERGEPLTFTQGSVQTENLYPQSFGPAHPGGQQPFQTPAQKSSRVGCWMAFFFTALALTIVGVFVLVKMAARPDSAQHGPAQDRSRNGGLGSDRFAAVALEFGSDGIGAGQFKDARSLALDAEGRIYVGEYTGGRVQVFDRAGKFITQWTAERKAVLLNLAADRKGTVYVVNPSHIFRYNGATGELLGEVERLNGSINEFYSDAFVALDGQLYAIGSNSNIVRIGADGKIKSTIRVSEKVGEDVSLERVAVSGRGDIYGLSRDGVFKFGPDGRYINRFGGRGDGPGQFRSANAIAVDGQGRVYVSDSGRPIQVFDENGRYLDSFGGQEVVFGLAINDQNALFASYRNRRTIVKFVPNKQ